MRGLFALWVLIFHIGLWSPLPGWNHIPIIAHGYLAVDFFFVLSGFILARRHGAEFIANPVSAYWPFIERRIARLFPLHLIVLAACLIALAVNHDLPFWRYAVDEAALVHLWGLFPASGTPMNPPDWSISTEWAASLLFPAFAWFGLRRPLPMALLGVLSAGGIIFIAGGNAGRVDITNAHSVLPLIRCLCEFGLGVIVSRGIIPASMAGSRYVAGMMAAVAIAAIFGLDLLAICALAPMVGALAWDRGVIARALAWGPLHWLGRVSYSIYLVQVPVLLTVRMAAVAVPAYQLAIYFAGSIVAVLSVAAASNAFIEQRGARSVRYLARAVRINTAVMNRNQAEIR